MALTKVQAAGLTADLIDETKLADNSIDSEHYNDGSIDEAHLADDAVTADKLANSINSEIAANTAKATNATHTGDVTGSGALTIADNAVTLAKMAGGTDGQIITYDASGDPIAVGPGTDGQVLTSTGAGSPPAFETLPASNNYTHPNHTGDVTSSGDGGTTIADNAVTLAKMAGLARGKIIYGDSSGDPAALTVGSSGTYLTSDGTDISWGSVTSFVTGMIILWSGNVASIPSGWVLCNGSNSTPDLRDN